MFRNLRRNRRSLFDVTDRLVGCLSGEDILKYHANGGLVVLIRSLLVSVIIYSSAVGLQSITREGALLAFSFAQLTFEISETIPWLGAIFAGVYAVFYSRFSSQWIYLASLYNQLMSARVHKSQDIDDEELLHWEAGFVEDAIALHLATKPMFAPAVKQFLEDPNILQIFLETTQDSQVKYNQVKNQLGLASNIEPDPEEAKWRLP